MARLTVNRLFSDPPLAGRVPVDLRFSPDGEIITYRAAASDDGERMDLWQINAAGEHQLCLDAQQLQAVGNTTAGLSAAERAERERRRQFTFGVNQYIWHPDSERVLIPLDGQAYLCDFSAPGRGQAGSLPHTAMCPAGSRQSGFQFSTKGNFLSFVRDGDLYCRSLHGTDSAPIETVEQRLTHDAAETLSNGLPDFLAAEEMHRFTGHWWSEDEQTIAYCKVDSSSVAVSHRLELDADVSRTVAQRYPYAGQTNPRVALHLYHLASGRDHCIWQSPEDDAYLARVQPTADGFVILSQDRQQQQLQLRSYHLLEQQWHTIYVEKTNTWINLSDDLRVLENGQFLYSSERNGGRQVLLLSADGSALLLAGPTHINAVLGHTESTVLATGWDSSPTENHLFQLALDGSRCVQLSQDNGWHEIVLNRNADAYIDKFSSVLEPLTITHHRINTGTTLQFQQSPSQKRQLQGKTLYAENYAAPHPYAPYVPSHTPQMLGELTAADGQRLCYRLTPPAKISGTHPTIVYVYGGPGVQRVRNEWSPLLLQLFAHQGYGVLELDNRGSGNRGRTFEAPLYRQLAEVEVADQVAGLAVLDNFAWTDPARIGVFGHSYGGYLSLMCLCQAGAHFKAGVAAAPVCDWHLYDSHYTERYLGLPDDNPHGYTQANVLSHLAKLDAPLLLLHGMADDNVLFAHSTQIMSALQNLGKPFELMTYPGAKHSMQERSVARHRFNLLLDFFNRHL